MVNLINQLQNRNALVLSKVKQHQIEQKAEFDIAQFQKDFKKLEGETRVKLATSGVELGTGTAANIELSNAYEAKLQENLIRYNSQVAVNNKMEEANFARIRGTMARQESKLAQINTVARTGSLLYGMKSIMPKIPTFTARGSIEQLAGTTSNIQMGLNNTLAGALAPVTDMVVKKAIQENDTQNRTEALRLGNEFTREMTTLEETIANDNTGLGVNKQSANAYYKEQTNNLIDKFKSKSSNNATATLFTNNALSAVNRGIFRIDTIVDKNVFKDLGNQVEQAEKSLITQALFNNKDANVVDEFGMLGNVNDFDYASLQTNLTKLYTDAYSGKIPAANLDAIINDIPSVVQGFQANKDIYDNPSFAYTELEKGENSSVYPDLKVEQRTKLINKVETMMVQPMQKEFANVVFSLQDKGTEQPFDFDFAKKILPIEKYNELKTTYDLAKINAEDVRFIRTSSLSEANELIESKNFKYRFICRISRSYNTS